MNTHSGLGTHISRVRSVKMDSWTDAQLQRMKMGGNQQCKDFLKRYGIDFEKQSIRQRYDSAPAQLYKDVLDARIEGRPEPTELPERTQNTTTTTTTMNRKMEGFGSSPPPPAPNNKPKWKLGAYVVVTALFVAWYLNRP